LFEVLLEEWTTKLPVDHRRIVNQEVVSENECDVNDKHNR